MNACLSYFDARRVRNVLAARRAVHVGYVTLAATLTTIAVLAATLEAAS